MDDQTILRVEGDRLQPALLDRLTDDEPEQLKESMQNSVVSKGRLKKTVLRDLVWLLNTTAHDIDGELDLYPEVRQSVINVVSYGQCLIPSNCFFDQSSIWRQAT